MLKNIRYSKVKVYYDLNIAFGLYVSCSLRESDRNVLSATCELSFVSIDWNRINLVISSVCGEQIVTYFSIKTKTLLETIFIWSSLTSTLLQYYQRFGGLFVCLKCLNFYLKIWKNFWRSFIYWQRTYFRYSWRQLNLWLIEISFKEVVTFKSDLRKITTLKCHLLTLFFEWIFNDPKVWLTINELNVNLDSISY